MTQEIRTIYDRFYDNPDKQKNAKLIGTFQVIEQIEEDGWDEIFVGRNVDTDEVCLIKGREVCFIDSGTAYSVYPISNVMHIPHGQWIQWIFRGTDRGYYCSNCGGGCLLNLESDWHKSTHCPHCGAKMDIKIED